MVKKIAIRKAKRECAHGLLEAEEHQARHSLNADRQGIEEEHILNAYRSLTHENSASKWKLKDTIKKWKMNAFNNVQLSIGFYRDRLYAGNTAWSEGWKFCFDFSSIFPIIKDVCLSFAMPAAMIKTPSYRCLKGVDFVLAQGNPLNLAKKLDEMNTNGWLKKKNVKDALNMAKNTIYDKCNKKSALLKFKFALKGAWDFGSDDAVGDNKDAKTRCIMNDKEEKVGSDVPGFEHYGGEQCYKFKSHVDSLSGYNHDYFYEGADHGCKCVRNLKWEECMAMHTYIGCSSPENAPRDKLFARDATEDECAHKCQGKTNFFALEGTDCYCLKTYQSSKDDHGLLQASSDEMESPQCSSFKRRKCNWKKFHGKCVWNDGMCKTVTTTHAPTTKAPILAPTTKAPIHAPTRSPTSTQCKAPNLKVFQLTSNITLEGSHSLLQSKQSRLRELSQRAIHGEISKDELLEIMDARGQVRETGIVSGTQWFADYIKTGKLNIPFCLGAKKYCDNDPLRAIYGSVTKKNGEECSGFFPPLFRSLPSEQSCTRPRVTMKRRWILWDFLKNLV